MTLFLGTHRPTWLQLNGPPLMVSRNTLPTRRLPTAVVPWVLDSGGFTELSMHGTWRIGAAEYAVLVARYRDEIGAMVWAAPQDWMCEPSITAKTGLTVSEHQERTTANLLDLRTIDATLPVIPVVQGWTLDDYLRHADAYHRAGVDLTAEPTVGVGSVCRRQHTTEAVDIFRSLAERGYRLHGFGLKAKGIAASWPWIVSADSLAWSYDARRVAARGVCCRRVYRGQPITSCANCRHYALDWYAKASAWCQPVQGRLW
jgi:hypothetical protein